MTLSSLKIIISEITQNFGPKYNITHLSDSSEVLGVYFPMTYSLINKVIYDLEDCRRFRIPRGAF